MSKLSDLFKNEDVEGNEEMNVPERVDDNLQGDADNARREMGTEETNSRMPSISDLKEEIADGDGQMNVPEMVDDNVQGGVANVQREMGIEETASKLPTLAELFKNEDAEGDDEMNIPERVDDNVQGDADNARREMGTENDEQEKNQETVEVAGSSKVDGRQTEDEYSFSKETGDLDNDDDRGPLLQAGSDAGFPTGIGSSSSAAAASPAGPSSSNDPPVNPAPRQREMPPISCAVCPVEKHSEQMIRASCKCGVYFACSEDCYEELSMRMSRKYATQTCRLCGECFF